jgi:hypothetical protein
MQKNPKIKIRSMYINIDISLTNTYLIVSKIISNVPYGYITIIVATIPKNNDVIKRMSFVFY